MVATHQKYRFGRTPRTYDPRIPHYNALRYAATTVTIPDDHDWADGLPDYLGMMLNGPTPGDPNAPELGDCVPAGSFHKMQIWTAIAGGKMITAPDSFVEKAYETQGYRPNDPNSDQGCNVQKYYHYWLKTGLPSPPDICANGHQQIISYVELDPQFQQSVFAGIYTLGAVGLGLNVPAYLMEGPEPPRVWDVPKPGQDTTIIGGHYITGTGFVSATGLVKFISWGAKYSMTKAFRDEYVDECLGPVDLLWLTKKNQTPLGLTREQLVAAAKALQSSGPVVVS